MGFTGPLSTNIPCDWFNYYHDSDANQCYSNSHRHDYNYNPSNDYDNFDANRYYYDHDSDNYIEIDNCIYDNFSDRNHDCDHDSNSHHDNN